MTPEQLRASILQQAMEGKLVKQDSTDEPASKLLEKIKAKKEQLDREKKIKKTKTLPEITEDEKPFDIPDSWEWTRLDKIAITINGDRSKNYPGKAYWISEGVPFINAGAVGNKYLNKTKFNYISDERYELLRSGFIEKNDILYCIRGSLGKNSISTVSKGAIASSLIIIRLISDDIRSDYLWYALNSSIGTDFVKEHRNGSAQPNIPGKDVLKMRLPLPPKIEQQRIVAKIEKLMPLVDEYEKAYNRLKSIDDGFNDKMKQSILQYAMEGKLVKQNLNDISAIQNLKEAREKIKEAIKNKELRKEKYTQAENNGKLPKNWGVARLKEICEKNNSSIKRGPFGSSITKSMFVPKGKDTYKVYEQGNAIRRDINYGSYYITKDKFESLSAFQVKPGDIIVSCAGTIGKTFILPPKIEPGIINQALLKLTLDTSIIDKKFFLLEFESISVQLNLHAKGSAIKNLASLKYLKNKVDFPLPPLEEQKRIVAKIEKLMPLVDEYAESYNRLQKIDNEFEDKLKQSVLQYAMEGKLVKQNLSDEPASELVKKIENKKAELIKEGKIKKSKKLPTITDDEKPFDIPDSWEWVRLGNIFDITSSKRVMKKEWRDSGIPFYRAREIVSINKNRPLKDPIFIDEDTYLKKIKISGKPNEGDILLTGVGTLGIPYIVPKDKKFYFKDGNIIWLKNFGNLNSEYLSWYVQCPYMLKIINDNRGTTVGTLTIVRSKNLVIPIPPLEEQKRIVMKIKEFMNSVSKLSK